MTGVVVELVDDIFRPLPDPTVEGRIILIPSIAERSILGCDPAENIDSGSKGQHAPSHHHDLAGWIALEAIV